MLFTGFNLAGLRLDNRIVRAATYEKRADEDGYVTDELIALYTGLARGGSGLIITGAAMIHPTGRYLRCMLSIHSDRYTEGLSTLTNAVHNEGGLIALQIDHGGRQCPALMLGGEDPLGPSAVPDPVTGTTARPMESQEIWEMAEAFASAASRARAAGFDAVEIQAAHGYLISSFLSPYTNRRDDYWGGDPMRRFHFLEETLKATREAVGDDFPIIVKLNATDHMAGGLTPEESLQIAQQAAYTGASAIEISGGMRQSGGPQDETESSGASHGAYYRRAGEMFTQSLTVPVILTGGLRSRADMQEVMETGGADLLGLSRPLIMDPNLPRLMMQGASDASGCDSCSECSRFSRLKHVECPRTAG